MLERRRGAIINVASTAAFQPLPHMSVYGATKAYVLSFSRALWHETRGTGVDVVAICPGATATEFFATAGDDASVGPRRTPEGVADSALNGLRRGRPTVIDDSANALSSHWPRSCRSASSCGSPNGRCARRRADAHLGPGHPAVRAQPSRARSASSTPRSTTGPRPSRSARAEGTSRKYRTTVAT